LISARDLINNVYEDYKKIMGKTLSKALEYSKKYGVKDARREYFMIITELNVWLLIQFDDFIVTQNKLSRKIEKYLTLSDVDRSTFVSNFDTINRASYLTQFMFYTEQFVIVLLKKLNQTSSNGYYKNTENLLNALTKNVGQNLKILILPAQVRNSLHGNGYTDYDIDVTLRGNSFKAKKGEQVKFTGWDNLYIMLDEMTDLIIDLVENSSINQEKFISKLH